MKHEDIPALIRELRQRLELTQEQFAQKVGVTYSTVNHWENGKRVPLPFLVKRLVELKVERGTGFTGREASTKEIAKMSEKQILQGQILTGSLFSEPMRVETVRANGPDTWAVGLVGAQSERFRTVTLTTRDLEGLTILDARHSYDGDGRLLRLGLQAYSLGIAYEFDRYFGLSISRVDPLPHQLEAIYDYLLKLARVRFLLAVSSALGDSTIYFPEVLDAEVLDAPYVT